MESGIFRITDSTPKPISFYGFINQYHVKINGRWTHICINKHTIWIRYLLDDSNWSEWTKVQGDVFMNTNNKWTKVSDIHPNQSGYYLVACRNDETEDEWIEVAYCNKKCVYPWHIPFTCDENWYVKYWMTLPDYPNAE